MREEEAAAIEELLEEGKVLESVERRGCYL